jgi:hypothetical protein
VESSQLEHVTISEQQTATGRTAVALFARGTVTGRENNQTSSSASASAFYGLDPLAYSNSELTSEIMNFTCI